MIVASRYHDICAGHRVVGHEGKCRHLHGHNYRITFAVQATELDSIGRVLDFSVIKSLLCEWLERKWDHKMLIWKDDPMLNQLLNIDRAGIYITDFNPTAENMGLFLLESIGPKLLPDNAKLVQVEVSETRKCSAIVTL